MIKRMLQRVHLWLYGPPSPEPDVPAELRKVSHGLANAQTALHALVENMKRRDGWRRT